MGWLNLPEGARVYLDANIWQKALPQKVVLLNQLQGG
jgi:hypothetical protein